jgi:hypothetical protein
MYLHHLGAFWMTFAIIRHPVAGIAALCIAGVVGWLFRGRK